VRGSVRMLLCIVAKAAYFFFITYTP
jgi:hypothetical protein